jgi:hypothetical protein
MSHSALALGRRKLRRDRPDYSRRLIILHEIVFWVIAVGILGTIILLLYVV